MFRLFASRSLHQVAAPQALSTVSLQTVKTSSNPFFAGSIRFASSEMPKEPTSMCNRPHVMQLIETQAFSSLTVSQRAAISKCLTNAEVVEWFRRTETKRRPEQVEKEMQPENRPAEKDVKRA